MSSPAEIKEISFKLRATRDFDIRSRLLAQIYTENLKQQTKNYESREGECYIYRKARIQKEKLPRVCEHYDCNGLRNPCPINMSEK